MASRTSSGGLPDGTYVVLVRGIHSTPMAHIIMSLAFLGVGSFVVARTPDLLLMILLGLGLVVRLVQVTAVLLGRRRSLREDLDADGARILERRFGWTFVSFATIFGAFSGRAIQISPTEVDLLLIVLQVGYWAGLMSGQSLRPRIAILAVLLSGVPVLVALPLTPDPVHLAVEALLVAFMVAAVHAILRVYRAAADDIEMRRQFAALARQDDLTGLPNRLALREAFKRFAAAAAAGDILAVHCLDLDRFKPVNDTHGHPAGDALLHAVAGRLNGLLRRGDIAARLGGDEFVIIQAGARHEDEVHLLARRISRAIAEPFSILGHQISIGASVGCALFPAHGRNLDDLLGRADDALVTVKRNGGGDAMHRQFLPALEQRLSA